LRVGGRARPASLADALRNGADSHGDAGELERKAQDTFKAGPVHTREASAATLPPPHTSNAATQKDIAAAGQAILAIYNHNGFLDLKVTWGTYPNNLGHADSPGCFRCRDGSQTTPGGTDTVTPDCGACRQILADGEPVPEVLKTLGLWDSLRALKVRASGSR
jgi:hypothetical protein